MFTRHVDFVTYNTSHLACNVHSQATVPAALPGPGTAVPGACEEQLRQLDQCQEQCRMQGQPQHQCQRMCRQQLEQGQGIKMVVNYPVI
ncbi:antimicrobial peptide X precursor-like [Pyrus ussuriensis x Pyrus communis]|uniref:Antimicrobial peptide X-like n=1 Tax=Pyrus ussuriensis x Pyrus communis TaxID=2448454 RepID=A0A5N5FEK0_9ROSA|nr:antimicrobial peptide X precursor-like [Pyrus ussuriensis x Pyrus communis]